MTTFLTQIGGYTPLSDHLIQETDLIGAAVYGVVWRYCQMKAGVCAKSAGGIAHLLGLSERTVRDRLKRLVEQGYLRKINQAGGANHYTLTDKLKADLAADTPAADTGLNDEPGNRYRPPRHLIPQTPAADTNQETHEAVDTLAADAGLNDKAGSGFHPPRHLTPDTPAADADQEAHQAADTLTPHTGLTDQPGTRCHPPRHLIPDTLAPDADQEAHQAADILTPHTGLTDQPGTRCHPPRHLIPDTSAPDSDKETHEETFKERGRGAAAPAPQKTHQQLFETLVRACRWELTFLSEKRRGQLNRVSRQLRQQEITPAQGESRLAGWYAHDWRSQKGDPLDNPQVILDNWARFSVPTTFVVQTIPLIAEKSRPFSSFFAYRKPNFPLMAIVLFPDTLRQRSAREYQ